MRSLLKVLCVTGIIFCAANGFSDTITLQEVGVTPLQAVNVYIPGRYDGGVYAGAYQLLINGVATAGYCIEYMQWAPGGPTSYDLQAPADTQTNRQIAWIMQNYNPATSSADQVVDAQIAIWLILAGNFYNNQSDSIFHVSPWSGGYGSLQQVLALVTLIRGLDLGNFDMSGFRIADNVVYQNYGVPVPEPGTLLLLGIGLVGLGIGVHRRKK